MKPLKAIAYLESSTGVERVTVEFKCWEQLYDSIQALQYTHPAHKVGLERLIDGVPQDFPVFEWQMPWVRLSHTLVKPQPVTVADSVLTVR